MDVPESGSPLALALAALPAVAAILRVVWPSGQRSLAHRIERLAKTRESLAESPSATRLVDEALEVMAHQLAYEERRRLRRSVDGASVAAVIFVGVTGGAISWGLSLLDEWWWTAAAVLIASFAVLLIAAGLPQIMKYSASYGFEEES